MKCTPLLNNEDTDEESPPLLEFPQVTTDPSVFNAAKASVEKIIDTPLLSNEDTDEEFPP